MRIVDRCPVCHSLDTQEFSRDRKRIYFICNTCSLVFVPRNLLIDIEAEKQRYETHNNLTDDPLYRAYLMKIVDSVHPVLSPGDTGLDFGAGKTTLLADLLEQHGYQVSSYDLFFRPDESIWQHKYDFIILSEVIEHLREPLPCMQRLQTLLKDGGQMFIKTKFYPKDSATFKNWYYKNDMTHVQFFNENSMNKLAKLIGFRGQTRMIGEDLYRI